MTKTDLIYYLRQIPNDTEIYWDDSAYIHPLEIKAYNVDGKIVLGMAYGGNKIQDLIEHDQIKLKKP